MNISFDYLCGGRVSYRRIRLALAQSASEGVLTPVLACVLVLAAAWSLESAKLQRARVLEETLSRQAEHTQRQSARIALRYRLATQIRARLAVIDAAVGSGAEEARQLTEVAGALPRRSWLTSLSVEGSNLALEGAAPDLRELGRTIGALGNMRGIGDVALVEAAAFPQARAPEALRYRIRVTRGAP